jgi:hypothetical protein
MRLFLAMLSCGWSAVTTLTFNHVTPCVFRWSDNLEEKCPNSFSCPLLGLSSKRTRLGQGERWRETSRCAEYYCSCHNLHRIEEYTETVARDRLEKYTMPSCELQITDIDVSCTYNTARCVDLNRDRCGHHIVPKRGYTMDDCETQCTTKGLLLDGHSKG